MKRNLLSLSALLISTIVFAQAPLAFKYQAVVRDNTGNLLAEQSVGIQIDILKGAPDGTSVYNETHVATTNEYGLVNLEIGSGTSTDDFGTINWGDDDYFLQISLDASGGTSYELLGTSQLLSVPYALHSSVADSVVKESQTLVIDGNTLSISDGNSVDLPDGGTGVAAGNYTIHISGDISDSEAAQKLANELGPNTRTILVYQTTNLTTLDLSDVKFLDDLNIQNNASLSTILVDNLETCNNLSIRYCNSLVSIEFPLLSTCWSFDVFTCDNLNVLSVPQLASSFELTIQSCPEIVNLILPELASASQITIAYTSITSIGLPKLGNVRIFGVPWCSLTSESINAILALLVSFTSTPEFIELNNQFPPAPPTGQGIIDKGALILNGANVQTD